MKSQISDTRLEAFSDFLRESEKSSNTIEKYIRDIKQFLAYVQAEGGLDRSVVVRYKGGGWTPEKLSKDQCKFHAVCGEQLLEIYREK